MSACINMSLIYNKPKKEISTTLAKRCFTFELTQSWYTKQFVLVVNIASFILGHIVTVVPFFPVKAIKQRALSKLATDQNKNSIKSVNYSGSYSINLQNKISIEWLWLTWIYLLLGNLKVGFTTTISKEKQN